MKRALALLLLLTGPLLAARSEIRNGRFYVDNQPFYVRAVGYAPWRPHQHPGLSYVDTNRRWTTLDFERIKAAHFNTVRTWDPLDPEELALASKNGLMVLQGIRLDTRQDFSDPRNQETSIARIKQTVEQSQSADNILGYLVMTEPSPEAVVEAGEIPTMTFFRRMKRAIGAIDPRPVSMDASPSLAFLNLHEFDFVTVNLFAYWPRSLTFALGITGLNRWFVDHFAEDRPFIVGETGGYAVSVSSTIRAGGAGGFSEYDQSVKDLDSLRASVEGHASGAVLSSWIDRWHAAKDFDTHDDDPLEWNGMLGIPTDSKKDIDGIPRRVVADATVYNEVIVLEPKANHFYQRLRAIPIEANGAENTVRAEYNLNQGDWKPLESSGLGWFNGFFTLPATARRRQVLTLRVLDEKGTPLGVKEISFITGEFPEELSLKSRPIAKTAKGYEFAATAIDGYHRPVARRKINYGCFYPISLRETQGTVISDTNGEAHFICALSPAENDRYLFAAVGMESSLLVRTGDMRIFPLRPR